ncbi:hypothetical protein IQ266_08960 [filamentous cyanobacterium LEGE 11480]|uniref:Uncharacterized protein n=1 Tax=Romeriopsis navalis LEGE 11480 TaxID=2777977 RepID=A0A928VNW7_9CYAN|nr:hypothetical protein [Romeriopsis navalis]MBE9029857.1 hypothetical protein [Romeriopsis navalis LEGE 11480]
MAISTLLISRSILIINGGFLLLLFGLIGVGIVKRFHQETAQLEGAHGLFSIIVLWGGIFEVLGFLGVIIGKVLAIVPS